MVFKRRDRRHPIRVLRDLLWPRSGWSRAISYLKHRVRRLPGSPEKIARGIWAGLFVTFSPFVGVHFIVAAILAFFMRANVVAALVATILSNPLTLPPIGWGSLRTGYLMLGLKPDEGLGRTFLARFGEAFAKLWMNFKALFGPKEADWTWLPSFYEQIFYPYLIGGILPGVIVAYLGYFASVPAIRAYQNRRRGNIAAKLKELREKAKKPFDPPASEG